MTDDRQLIPMEEGMELFNCCASSLNVVIVSQILGFLDEEIIRQSLDLVQSCHPRLNSHIIGSLDNLRFRTEGTEKIPLQIIINSELEYWQKVVVNELSKKIESQKVLLRAILLKPDKESNINYLITTVHHAIIDAISGIYLHSEILRYCQKIVSSSQIPTVSKLRPLPSLEELMANVTTENTETQKSTQQPHTLPLEHYVSHQQRSCRLIHRQLVAKLTNQIINSCKNEKVTVHGAICAAMMLALAKEIRKDNRDLYFSCRSSVDMRRRVNPPIGDENIAMIVSALTSFHTLTNKTSFWDLAREVTQQIKARLKTQEIYNVILSYKNKAEYVLEHPELVSFSIFVTNVGKVKIPSDYSPFQLKEITYLLSTTVMGNVFSVAVSTFHEKMTLNFMFTQPLISDETANNLVNKALSYLLMVSTKELIDVKYLI
ncbi:MULTISPECIES: phthiocerol/phthiodiolone dimycocerosyl transferase family protein [Nostoc]|uniref:Phthiocerol/phthiodiolone dimycocerosyl transferase n=1 Tax=Nostoc paludosum FACHB-159 TaxID=2692908 RepID=A0ABR8KNN7_9NOSO|nr:MULTISPECIES: condensation domain-containing protein [Nostoc]MBD2683080.1 alcohol acetyltransferase [Nostoc sp. FACHB-857]MBD2739422.1 alcohol acetyltransferase [Nostoc paludosum FACHB-159]